MTVPTANVTLCLIDGDHVRAEPVPAHDHVNVHLAGNFYVFSSDPTVMEACARAFWDAADHLHAKAGITTTEQANVARTLEVALSNANRGRALHTDVPDPDVARTLAIATGGAA